MKNDYRTRNFISFLLIMLTLVGSVYATTIGPTGISDTLWTNSTYGNFEQIFINDVNYTQSIIDGSGSSSPPVSGNFTYPDTVTCVIDLDHSGYYTAYLYNGTVLYNDTDAYDCLQAALDFATSDSGGTPAYFTAQREIDQGSIKVGSGIWSIGNDQISVPNRVHFYGCGASATTISGTHTTSVISPMWGNYTYDVWISDMRIQGSSGTTDYPLKWYMTESTLPGGETYDCWFKLTDVHVRNYQTGPILLQTTTGSSQCLTIWNNVRCTGTIYINRISDSEFNNVFCYGLDLDSIATNHFNNWYVGGENSPNVYLHGDSAAYPNDGNIFTNFRSDNAGSNALYISGYGQKNSFVACQFTNSNSEGADALVRIGGTNTFENTFTGCFFGDYPRQSADNCTYLIQLDANSHDNYFIGNIYDVSNATNGAVLDNGSDNNVEVLNPP